MIFLPKSIPPACTPKKGDDWYAQSIYNDFCVHTTYNNKDKVIGPHEDTHLLTLSWGLAIGFFQEGLAEYMVGHDWYGDSHDERVCKALEKQVLPPFETMFTHQAWLDTPDKDKFSATDTATHELMHFMFHKYYDHICKDRGLDQNQMWDVKESFTVLLNLEFNRFRFQQDWGYYPHQELREVIRDSWLKNADFNKTLESAIDFVRK
jgi:hypothetical protein